MEDAIEIVGIDWSDARDAGRRAWVCRAEGVGTDLQVADAEWGVSMAPPLVDVVVGDRGGDALDAVLAAVSAYHHAAGLSTGQHANLRARADLLEGHIYAAIEPDAGPPQ